MYGRSGKVVILRDQRSTKFGKERPPLAASAISSEYTRPCQKSELQNEDTEMLSMTRRAVSMLENRSKRKETTTHRKNGSVVQKVKTSTAEQGIFCFITMRDDIIGCHQ